MLKVTHRFYLLRNSSDPFQHRVILQSNNRVELQFIKDILEMELPPDVNKITRYTIEENPNFIKNNSQNGSSQINLK